MDLAIQKERVTTAIDAVASGDVLDRTCAWLCRRRRSKLLDPTAASSSARTFGGTTPPWPRMWLTSRR